MMNGGVMNRFGRTAAIAGLNGTGGQGEKKGAGEGAVIAYFHVQTPWVSKASWATERFVSIWYVLFWDKWNWEQEAPAWVIV
jgi:hypothetical protein